MQTTLGAPPPKPQLSEALSRVTQTAMVVVSVRDDGLRLSLNSEDQMRVRSDVRANIFVRDNIKL